MATILLVEDNELNRDMLVRRLSRRGFHVETAHDGQEAIDKVRALRPQLVLMDISLPVMDGYEATEQLKSDIELRTIPVIGLSAHALSEEKERALAAGCDDYDTKPVDFQRLLGKIQAFLGDAMPEDARGGIP